MLNLLDRLLGRTRHEHLDDGKMLIAHYKKGVRNGAYEIYFENGKLREKGTYKDGKKDGAFEEYWENGQLKCKGIYRENVINGPYEEYHNNGQLWIKGSRCAETSDWVGQYEEYSTNGQPLKKCVFNEHGELDGSYEEFFLSGKIKEMGTYKNGKRIGPYERYYENGQLLDRTIYGNSIINIPYEKFYENGQLWIKGTKDGCFGWNGPYVEYYENGQLKKRGIRCHESWSGISETYYDKNGKLEEKYVYKDGVLIERYEYDDEGNPILKFGDSQNDKEKASIYKEIMLKWMKQHPNPTREDFLGYMDGTDKNVITCLVHSGLDVLEKAFPIEKWATMEAIPELKKIFATVPREEELMETMQNFDSKLRTTYNLNQRKQARKKQTPKKPMGNQGDSR